jgi:hypothetical protein
MNIMRNLTSKQEEAKKQKRNQMTLGIILVIVMFGSVFAIVVDSFNSEPLETQEKITYFGYEFKLINNYYVLEVGEYIFYFLSDPNDLVSLEKEVKLTKVLSNYIGKVLYIDSTNEVASQQLHQNIYPYTQRIQYACINETTCEDENLPIKTCEENVIVVRESEENKIYQEENCIFVEGKKEDLLKLTDSLILNLIGLS